MKVNLCNDINHKRFSEFDKNCSKRVGYSIYNITRNESFIYQNEQITLPTSDLVINITEFDDSYNGEIWFSLKYIIPNAIQKQGD